ncbi:hypothetical protein WR25_04770 isoform J [Diploscapter pachys]|uniref:G-protein coupled receptors family 1 profile domain-containing protein n=1 Tax=Diploscapter pachys TaxID=2018661 RepID=A0A2A2L462_9BILA|nr:hypothetical protein WR25_04770 isoform I [Diploscapter pachys]PAV80931.1 hypothetical protein WR25_04770 isoform J [Diploscapter pachys]
MNANNKISKILFKSCEQTFSTSNTPYTVALCVMSFGVYYQWNNFEWGLGQFFCNVYLASDVACSTASILNLLAISLDRYIAISHPIAYAQYGARGGRAMLSITIVWGVSLAVALPILFGINPMESPNQCELGNPYFNLISSIFSFFIPCAAMIVLYTVIFRRLRDRERARSLRQAQKMEHDKISTALLGGASFARQLGKQFKNRADQILLEISFQTSSYPTNSDSSDDVSTPDSCISPMLMPPSPMQKKSLLLITESGSMPNINIALAKSRSHELVTNNQHTNHNGCNGNALQANVVETGEPKNALIDLHNSIALIHDKCQDTMTRSFGDELEDMLPFIDGISSRKQSKEELHHPPARKCQPKNPVAILKRAETRPELRSISVPSMQDEKRLAQQYKEIRGGRVVSRKIVHKTVSGTFNDYRKENGKCLANEQTVEDAANADASTTLIRQKGTLEYPSPKKEKSSMFTDLLSPDDFSIADSFLKCKNRLWKRFSSMTSGWKTPRPSKQLVKKATKQMRREHKATITLAVVLGRFCRVIIACHHRTISEKLTLRIQFSITHFLKHSNNFQRSS